MTASTADRRAVILYFSYFFLLPQLFRIVFSFILHGLERIPYVFLIFLIRHAIPFIMGRQHFHSCFAFLHQPVCNTRQEILALKRIFRQCLLQERRQAALQFLHHALGKSPRNSWTR